MVYSKNTTVVENGSGVEKGIQIHRTHRRDPA